MCKNGTELLDQIIRECLIGFRVLNIIHLRALMRNIIYVTNIQTALNVFFHIQSTKTPSRFDLLRIILREFTSNKRI